MMDSAKSFEVVRMTFDEGKKRNERMVDRCGFDFRGWPEPAGELTWMFPSPSPVAYRDESGATSNAVIGGS
jgi:hypothetical protein